jgi:endonuclease I
MEALLEYSLFPVQFKSSKQCTVKSGKWISLFSGKEIFNASEIDIDHVVPLSWAWKHGADTWSESKRVKFANDPANLISVEASLNRQKGDKGIDNWLPPKNKCQYIVKFLKIQKSYGLRLSISELARYKNLKVTFC